MSYDAIIIGAGHNGLVAANYLAKAGKKVLVLERREIAGVLGPHHGELALKRTDAAHEVRRERPVAAASGVRALPPALAH